jgi:hypothetical protein
MSHAIMDVTTQYLWNPRSMLSLIPLLKSRHGAVWPCADCPEEAHPYVLLNTLWLRIGAPARFLCLTCLEKRLGRPVRRADFQRSEPLNKWLRWRGNRLVLLDPVSAWRVITKSPRKTEAAAFAVSTRSQS